jgi:hypothetical protein
VYPNPVGQQLTVEGIPADQRYQLQVFDVYGRQVVRYSLRSGESVIEVGHLSAGLYHFKIRSQKGMPVKTGWFYKAQ